MIYKNLKFPSIASRPFFYSNFVSTVDGKVVVTIDPQGYWPIGSSADRETMTELRAPADALIHGATTAMGHRTLDSLTKPEFTKQRKKHGKKPELPYFVLAGHPTLELQSTFTNTSNIPLYLVTTEKAFVPPELEAMATIIRFGKERVDLQKLSTYMHKKGYKNVLVEGGPHVMGSFLAEDLIDELFLTIAPKIFGNDNHSTLTFAEGHLFHPKDIKKLELLSVKPHEDELFLRYKIKQ